MQGIAYGVGVGPGDPELLTLKAVRILKEADVIAHSGKAPEDCVAFRIAVQAVPEIAQKELLPIDVPMTRDRQVQEIAHDKTARLIGEYLDAGKNVACLTLGDPSIYSSFSYYRMLLEKNGYHTEMISAVPSFCAAAAALNISLAEWDEPMHVIPALYQKDHETQLPGTVIYMKIGKQLKELKASLLEKHAGLRTDLHEDGHAEVYMVSNCGLEGESIYRGMDEIPDETKYFSTMIVKPAEKNQ